MIPSRTGPQICSVGRALPEHHVDQDSVLSAVHEVWRKQPNAQARRATIARLEPLHRALGVQERYFALPFSAYEEKRSFAQRNDVWIDVALDIGERAIVEALGKAGLGPKDVDHLFFVTVTGIAAPNIDARLVNRLRMRPDVKRTPIFGLGCVAGAAGTARAADYLRAFPHETAVLLSVELCTLTFQLDDISIPNALASGLFGDGGAAVVLAGAARSEGRGPRVVASCSVFYPDTEEVMGWQVVDGGFKIVLSGGVPRLAQEHMREDVDKFLATHGLRRSDIAHWIAHTGGPKVLVAFEEALDLPDGALVRSWNSLRRFGNLSSASVLFVLSEVLDEREIG